MDEDVIAAPAADAGAGNAGGESQTPPVDTGTAPAPDGTPAAGTPPAAAIPDYEALFADPAAETAVVDPNAPPAENAAGAVPAEFQQALGISEYVKDATQLAGAVTLADEVLKVQNGQAPVTGLLENFRAQNGAAFEKMARESLIPYVEQLTGLKLMDPANAAAATQKTPEQERIERIEQRFQQQEQERQNQAIQQEVQKASTVLLNATTEALKGTFLEGQAVQIRGMLGPHMGMTEEQAVKALNAGNTGMVAKAVKAVLAQREADGRAYAKWKIAESKTLKTALPAGKGNPRGSKTGDGKDLASMTREQRVSYLAGN